MGFQYDVHDAAIGVALKIKFSVLPAVLAKPSIWIFLFIHLAVLRLANLGYFDQENDVNPLFVCPWKFVAIVATLTTFFEVFYTGHIFVRYVKLYDLSHTLLQHISNIIFDVRLHTSEAILPQMRLSCRYTFAAIYLHFADLNKETPGEAWKVLSQNNLLYEQERKVLTDHVTRPQQAMIVLRWAAQAAQKAMSDAKCPGGDIKKITDRITKTRATFQDIHDCLEMPMPFAYFHLLNLMIIVNLSFWAYGMGTLNSVFAPVGFFFAELLFCGMMELSAQMSDPFGKDEVDFPCNLWLSHIIQDAGALLEFDYSFTQGGDKWKQMASTFPRMSDANLMTLEDSALPERSQHSVFGYTCCPVHEGSWI